MSSSSSPPHIIGSTHEQMIEDDEQPQLSQSTLDALNQFLAEAQAASDSAQGDPFAENWALSQVWMLLWGFMAACMRIAFCSDNMSTCGG